MIELGLGDLLRVWRAYGHAADALPGLVKLLDLGLRAQAQAAVPSSSPTLSSQASLSSNDRMKPADTPARTSPGAHASPIDDLTVRLIPLPTEQRSRPSWTAAEALPEPGARWRRSQMPLLFPPRRARALLADVARVARAAGTIDIDRAVAILAARRPLATIPRRTIGLLTGGVQLVIDRSRWMEPFATDSNDVRARMIAVVGATLDQYVWTDDPDRGRRWRPPSFGVPIVALTDLGEAAWRSGRPMAMQRWVELVRVARQHGNPVTILQPGRLAARHFVTQRHARIVPWDHRTRLGKWWRRHVRLVPTVHSSRTSDTGRELAIVCSAAARLDLPIIRRLRIALCPELDASAESKLWFADFVQARTSAGLTIDPAELDTLRADLVTSGRLARVLAVLEEELEGASPLLTLEQRLISLGLREASAHEIELAVGQALVALQQARPRRDDIAGWALRALPRLPKAVRSNSTGWALRLAAEARTGLSIKLADRIQGRIDDISHLLPDGLPSAEISIRRGAGWIELSEDREEPSFAVPATTPRIIEVNDAISTSLVAVSPGASVRVPTGSGEVVLRNLRGERWRARVEGTPLTTEGPSSLAAYRRRRRHGMATGPTEISAAELDAVLDQAREEGWQELALIVPGILADTEMENGVSEARTFVLREALGPRIDKVSSLMSLTKLSVSGNGIGDEGARALGRLRNLTWLTVGRNGIGAEGARALGGLRNLTALSINGNVLRDEGVRALEALSHLTTLAVRSNGIGDEGARALGALKNLTSLDASSNYIGDEGARALGRLKSLTSLRASVNRVGAEGARALGNLANLKSLDVGGNQIGEEGARALGRLTNLTSLDVGVNQIDAEGARALGRLTNLTSLDVAANQIGDEGARALGGLTNLTSLNVSVNQIGDEGARALGGLTNLTRLEVHSNHVADEGARALGGLTNLTRLNIGSNEIGDEGTRALGLLTNLANLEVGNNHIEGEGARAIGKLTNLTSLDMSNNRIGEDGARALRTLTNLTRLDVRNNQVGADGLRTLLDAWCEHPRSEVLRHLDLRDNGDLTPVLPLALLESTDAQAILAAYRRYREAERSKTLRPLNEAKLVVIGNKAVGKTSLIRYLVQGKPRDPDERKTPGTAIHEKIEVSTWSPHQSQVRLNVWDFGGQEIMRGTYRFFLTARSLYLLVVEDRREDDRSIYEWLEIIAQCGGDSAVIVVINKSDHDVPQRQLDEAALRRTYPVIVDFVRTSCNAGATAAQSIAALRAQIAATISDSGWLKHVRDLIPLPWLRIKEAIAEQARQRSVLPVLDFERLCESPSAGTEPVVDPNEQRALLGLLHDLGVVVAHGLRDEAPAAQREITVLDPNWLTGAIYALISSPKVRDQGGELRQDQLTELLEPARYPAKWHELILGMMQEPALGLCLPIAGSKPLRYLLPDALPVKEPDYGVWPADALRFRYQYSLLPIGLIPRFIAQAHHNLTLQPTLWRTGVVLGAEGCRILVRGDAATSRVEILVAGKAGQRAALSIVRNHFDAVHRHYAKLKVEERVPLPDQPDVDVGYEHLAVLEREVGLEHTFIPQGARRKYSVRELLEGVRDTTDPRERRRRARAEDEDPMFQHDLAVLVPLQEEFRVWFPHLQDPNPDTQDHHTYYTTTRNQRSLVTTFIGDMGPTPASAVASALLRQYRPRLLVVLGIAGALNDDIDLGDVVVATEVDAYFDSGKASGDDQYELRPGGTSFRAEARLVDLVRNLEFQHAKLHQRWQSACETRAGTVPELQQANVPLTPKLHNGKIASGPFVAASTPFRDWLLRRDRRYKAVEMEAAGANWAAERAPERRPALLVIRGISDDATPKKTKLDKTGAGAIRRHAMHNAIDLLLALIDSGLLP